LEAKFNSFCLIFNWVINVKLHNHTVHFFPSLKKFSFTRENHLALINFEMLSYNCAPAKLTLNNALVHSNILKSSTLSLQRNNCLQLDVVRDSFNFRLKKRVQMAPTLSTETASNLENEKEFKISL
jgi:hypothetical protein